MSLSTQPSQALQTQNSAWFAWLNPIVQTGKNTWNSTWNFGAYILQSAYDFLTQPVQSHVFTQPNVDPLALPAAGEARDKRKKEEKVKWDQGLGLSFSKDLNGARVSLKEGKVLTDMHPQLIECPLSLRFGYEASKPEPNLLQVELSRRALFSAFPKAMVPLLQTYLDNELSLDLIVVEKPEKNEFEPLLHALLFPKFQEGNQTANIDIGVFADEGVFDSGKSCPFGQIHRESVSVNSPSTVAYELSAMSKVRMAMTPDTPFATFGIAVRVSDKKAFGALVLVVNRDQMGFIDGKHEFVTVDQGSASVVEMLMKEKSIGGLINKVKEKIAEEQNTGAAIAASQTNSGEQKQGAATVASQKNVSSLMQFLERALTFNEDY